jgi:nucleotide-binding universal stress UspA family protein
MEKILVTTDQSSNSKAAIRFAIQLAKQRKAELIILHIYHNIKPFSWSERIFEEYEDTFKKKSQKN